jgi:hypothetical protein
VLASLLLKQGNARESERRLDEWRDLVGVLEASEDPNYVDTAAAWWEARARVAEVLGRIADATEASRQAVILREKIKSLES